MMDEIYEMLHVIFQMFLHGRCTDHEIREYVNAVISTGKYVIQVCVFVLLLAAWHTLKSMILVAPSHTT